MLSALVEVLEEFGKYRVLKLLGRGGMAEVFLAEQLGPNDFVKPCVLKRITPNFVTNNTIRKMFLEEAKLSALLNHPNIVQTFDFGEVDGQPYMAMEFVDGVNLAAMCRQLSKAKLWISTRTAAEITLATAQALAYAHELKSLDGVELQLVHRDVSPQNILISKEGAVKLADFGIAKQGTTDEPTILPGVKGKPGYMAPEQHQQLSLDGRSDIFALGILLTELCCGRRVRKKKTGLDYENLEARITELLPTNRFGSALPALAKHWTSLDPESRPGSAAVACHELEQTITLLGDGPSTVQSIKAAFSLLAHESQQVAPDSVLSPRSTSSSYDASLPSTAELKSQNLDPGMPPSKTSEEEQPSQTASANSADLLAYWDAPSNAAEDDLLTFEFAEEQDSEQEQSSIEVVYSNWQEFFSSKGPVNNAVEPPDEIQQRGESHLSLGLTSNEVSLFASEEAAQGTEDENLSLELEEQPLHEKTSEPKLQLAEEEPPEAKPLAPLAKPSLTREHHEEGPKNYILFAVIAVIAALALVYLLQGSDSDDQANFSQAGKIKVTSHPSGAQIFLANRDTGDQTPTTLSDLPLDLPIRISVRMEGRIFQPQSLTLSPQKPNQTLHFQSNLNQRIFRLISDPEDANVSFNLRKLTNKTPLALPPINSSESATITLSKAGFISKNIVITNRATTATITTVELEASRQVVIRTTPPGAEIYVGEDSKGPSPTKMLDLPSKSHFTVRAELAGYRPHSQKYSLQGHNGPYLDIELKLAKLNRETLSAAEAKKLRTLQSRVQSARDTLKKTRQLFRSAEAELHRQQNEGTSNVAKMAETFKRAEKLRNQIQLIDERLQDALTARDTFREQLISANRR